MNPYIRKRKNNSDSPEIVSTSAREDTSSSLTVIEEGGRDYCSEKFSKNISSAICEYSHVDQVVAGNRISQMHVEDLLFGKAADGCSNPELTSRDDKKILEMGNSNGNRSDRSSGNGGSDEHILEQKFELAKRCQLKAVENMVHGIDFVEENYGNLTGLGNDKAPHNASCWIPSNKLMERKREFAVENTCSLVPQLTGLIEDNNQVINEFKSSTTGVINELEKVTDRVMNEGIKLPLERSALCCSRKKLLVLDVNGLLVDLVSCVPDGYQPDAIISRKAVFKRPYCDAFLQFCFEKFNVGVWSSRIKRNADLVLDFLFGNARRNLLFTWDQFHCTQTGFYTVENREKPLILKKLKKLWEKEEPDLPWERGEYNESNTILVDDSPYKALCNPPNTGIFPYTYRFRNEKDNSIGPGGEIRVYLEGLAMAENVQEYIKQHPFGQRPITEKNASWRFYSKVIEAASSPRGYSS